jgi:hypothetical protein
MSKSALNIREKDIHYYVERLLTGRNFCFPGYSDAEFYCMMGLRHGTTTGLGQIIDIKHGRRLLDVMQKRQNNTKWLFAIPKCLHGLPYFQQRPIDTFLKQNQVDITAYERDMVLDDLARDAGLFPFIAQLQNMDTVIIGPKDLERLHFLDYKAHFAIPSPNLHMEDGGIERAVDRVIAKGYKAVYLISAGVSAPIIIDYLYSWCPDNFYLDCGSIWDAFVGIGGQRQWRADLYESPSKLEAWRRKNLYGA